MPKDDLASVGHMLDTAQRAVGKIRGKARRDFDADENLRLALAYLLQIVGEVTRQVSPGFRASHPTIPWNAIIGMRHKVVHDYMNVDEDVVWRTATQELEPLIVALERLLPPAYPGAKE
jgi:uncharacterized protein with HEPN domain